MTSQLPSCRVPSLPECNWCDIGRPVWPDHVELARPESSNDASTGRISGPIGHHIRRSHGTTRLCDEDPAGEQDVLTLLHRLRNANPATFSCRAPN